jgi:hypothetical protein
LTGAPSLTIASIRSPITCPSWTSPPRLDNENHAASVNEISAEDGHQ